MSASKKDLSARKAIERQLVADIRSPATAATPEQQNLEALRIKTFVSPVRTKILIAMNMSCGESAGISVKQLSEKLGMSHGTVFYHVKQLQKAAFIEEAGTREVNGILERYYRPVKQLVRISPETAARMDIPINAYFEEIYQQTRKPVGRRSLMDEEVYVNEEERNEFHERYLKLCGEYDKPGEGRMHLAAICITYEVRDDADSAASTAGGESCSDNKA
ncbi:MAG TPA: winged helix-turn-helix domain-containing protein [Clostridia bacterium]|nr:winged helix-turn-helix domain-containing protein [Clostridia bacterium]